MAPHPDEPFEIPWAVPRRAGSCFLRRNFFLDGGLGAGSPDLGPVRVASAGVPAGDGPWAWFVCRFLLLKHWLDGGGLCLAVPPEALLEALPCFGPPGDPVASSPRLATSLFRLDERSGGGLPVVALPGGSHLALPGLGPPGVVAAIPRCVLLALDLIWFGAGACLNPCGLLSLLVLLLDGWLLPLGMVGLSLFLSYRLSLLSCPW